MRKPTKHQRTHLANLSDQELTAAWDWCDTQRVKSGRNKGQLKLSALRYSDLLLWEQGRRGKTFEPQG